VNEKIESSGRKTYERDNSCSIGGSDLQNNPNDNALREKIIIRVKMVMKPKPAIPEEAERFMARGTAAIKNAKNPDDFKDAGDHPRISPDDFYFTPFFLIHKLSTLTNMQAFNLQSLKIITLILAL
jgi:hypothetical protein